MARPKKAIDIKQVEELARIGCTEEDMAAVLGVSVDTIQRRKRANAEFCGAIKRGQAATRNSLRRLQLQKALSGNVTMLIWLGKQLLGQRDQASTEFSGPGSSAIPFSYVMSPPPPEEIDKAPELIAPEAPEMGRPGEKMLPGA